MQGICCRTKGVTSVGANHRVPLCRSGNNRARAAAHCTARKLCLHQRDMGVIECTMRRQLYRPRLVRLSCAQRAIVIVKPHGIAPSVATAQLDECAQTEGGRVDPRYEEWSYTGLKKQHEAAIAV